MREDNPATEIMNALSACINACGMLCLKPLEARRDAALDAVSWFVEAAPLDESHAVRAFGITKDAIRNGAAVATKLRPAVIAWDETTAPPASLVALAREFLVSVDMAARLEIEGAQGAGAPG